MKWSIVTLTACVVLSGCATTTKGSADYDPSVNFANYHTFAWISQHPMIVATAQGQQISPLAEGRIMRAIADSLTSKGYRLLDTPDNADFVVSFTVGARDNIQVTSYPVAYRGFYGRAGYWGGAYWGSDVDVQKFTEGRLAIDIFDRKEHRPIWHGWATKKITPKTQENPEPVINEVVAAILAKFPPTPNTTK